MVQIVEYIWLDAAGAPRSKTRVISDGETPGRWSYDGSSTGQATTEHSEIGLLPVSTWTDPLRSGGGRRLLVLCDLLDCSGNRMASSHRLAAERAFAALPESTDPWFGLEQEYYMLDGATGLPLGFTGQAQGEFYCGTNRGRALAEEHLTACIAAGLQICGVNSEVGPAQWEYQIGPVRGGVAAADQLIMSRWILLRLAEKHGVRISFHPKPLAGYNGSGCHTNVSTAATRTIDGARTGTLAIERILRRLREGHGSLMTSGACGVDNHLRLIGTHETSEMDQFTWGVGNRAASVRIGRETWVAGGGYFEDRRPAANMNPYQVLAALAPALLG
jgi:glutamine synthetase